jgi:hypothetical protein
MRKIIVTLVLFVAATAFTKLGDPQKDIVRKWKADESAIPVFKKIMIERYRKISPETAEQMEAAGDQLNGIIASIEYDYQADGSLEISTPQGLQKSTWKISDDKKYLTKVNAMGKETKDSIISITPEKMKLYVYEVKDTTVYIPAQ